MVIKYKAKYIRDGVVVIDDTELIELGTAKTAEQSKASKLSQESRAVREKIVTDSKERGNDVDPSDDTAPRE